MTFSAARGHRGLGLATAAVAAVTSCALGLTSSSAASSPAAQPTGSESGAQAGVTSTGEPAVSTAGPSAPVEQVETVATGDALVTAVAAEVAGGDRGVSRSRTVSVDTSALPTAADRVELPLFTDTTVVADLTAPAFRPEGGYRTWSGTIDGDEGSTVVFVEQDGVLAGLVTSKDATYRLRPLPDGSTRVEQMDESQFPTAYAHATPPTDGGFTPVVTTGDDHPHAPGTPAHSHEPESPTDGDAAHADGDAAHADGDAHSHAPGTPEHSHAAAPAVADGDPAGAAGGDVPVTTAATADAPVVDVLVAYSTAAKTRNGGQAGMDADIALMIEQTNSAFDTSGINAVLRLAHTAEVSINGPVDGATLGKLANPSDGVYDELHVLRDQYGADLISLITDSSTGPYCGIAYQMQSISTSFAPYAMSVTDAGCATGNMTFTHELGHNFGAAHDRGSWSGTPALPYGYDWVNPQQGWRTVMSYANACPGCGRLLRFSNPDQTYNGAPLGAPASASNAADNRAVLNTTSSTVASMRGAPAPASLTLTAPTDGQRVIASGKLVATWSTSGYMGSDAKVELLRAGTVVKILTAKVPLGTGRYEYALPLTTARATDYSLRITPLLAPQYAVTSDAFAVVDPAITPAFAGSPAAGGAARVTWTYTGAPGGTVKVELLKDGKSLAVLKTVAVGTGGAGLADVTLPAALNDGAGYRFRTTLSAVPKAPALTGGFSVTSTRQLVLTAPASGATAAAGAPLTVTWTAAGVLGVSVKAELVKGDLVAFTSAVAPSGSGTLTFTPPAKLPTGEDYRVRLVAVSFPTVIQTSESLTINGTSVSVTSQSSPSSIAAGRPLTVTFTKVGVPGTAVKLEAVAPNLSPVTIAASVPLAAGTYTWNVPAGLPRADWKIRATVVGNPLVTSTSAAATTVTWPTVSASASPSGVAGAPVTVSWAFTDGAAAPVKVRLLQGTRVVATVTAGGVTAADGTGSVTYRLPVNLAAGNYQFDVSAAANATIVAKTGAVPVTLPTLAASGAASAVRGQTATISWTFSDGAAVPVRIDLVQGTTVVLVKSGAVTANDGTGSFAYKAPTTLAAGTYTVRIRPVLLSTSAAIQGTRTFTVS
ncbi:MAG: hypothetical protein JWQ45_2950 [Blastococcus sp.]|nr:hypothetical protein [Blastococcus sp.]